mmetsp:Transcript_14268/g.48212  ORF Transcript_14268/g.48212 Transcript_14268/m.48212 type:complete len:235 (+) Transcript_14268:183-887(+)
MAVKSASQRMHLSASSSPIHLRPWSSAMWRDPDTTPLTSLSLKSMKKSVLDAYGRPPKILRCPDAVRTSVCASPHATLSTASSSRAPSGTVGSPLRTVKCTGSSVLPATSELPGLRAGCARPEPVKSICPSSTSPLAWGMFTMITECAAPQAIFTAVLDLRIATCSGTLRSSRSPWPSCPQPFQPQVRTLSRGDSKTIVCILPDVMRSEMLARDPGLFTGVAAALSSEAESTPT